MASYGYARVSTFDQDLTIQQHALRADGCGVVRAEKASGSRRDGRTELQVLLDFMQPGDTLVVTRIDRLARSLKDLQDIVHELKGRGVTLRATEQPVDTGTAAGKAFLDMLGVFAEFETTCAANASSKASRRPRRTGSTRAASPASTRPRSGVCGTRRSCGLPPSLAGSASAEPAYIAHSNLKNSRRSGPTQAASLLCTSQRKC